MQSVPNILRIKRRCCEDPLQALVIEGQSLAKRSKPSSPSPLAKVLLTNIKNYYFELSSTDTQDYIQKETDEVIMLSETHTLLDKRQFVFPKRDEEDEVEIQKQLCQMLNEFLKIEEDLPDKLKKRRGAAVRPKEKLPTESAEKRLTEEYVFDVYKLTSHEPLTSMNYPLSLIGYIRFFEDGQTDLVNIDGNTDLQRTNLSEDEDSNSESFYQNDYPEDEDADEFSETYERLDCDSECKFDYYGDYESVIYSEETAKSTPISASNFREKVLMNSEYECIYEDFFDERGNRIKDFLEYLDQTEARDGDDKIS